MKKLLEKLSVEEQGSYATANELERRLEEVMTRYKVKNESFAAEVINLHKSL